MILALPILYKRHSHFYQWQESFDNVNWTDISGETNEIFTTPALTTTTYYRAKVAEDAINLANPLCIALSETYEVNITVLMTLDCSIAMIFFNLMKTFCYLYALFPINILNFIIVYIYVKCDCFLLEQIKIQFSVVIYRHRIQNICSLL